MDDLIDYTHPKVNEMVSAIGGDYLFDKEARESFNDGELLYYTGFFMIDRSCCGVGGSAYALVAGFVVDWHCGRADDGCPVSKIRPIRDRRMRERIIERIKAEDPLRQVVFV